jgi:hypothetical protein
MQCLFQRIQDKIRPPPRIQPRSLELPMNLVKRTRSRFIGDSCLNCLAANHALQTKPLHQTFHRTTSHRNLITAELSPYFTSAIRLKILFPEALDVRA